MAKQFELEYEKDGSGSWTFDCAMISTCRPAFDYCHSNYDVEDKLRKAGVIRKNTRTDSESCALVVCFSSEKAYGNFIGRLNKYLREKERKLKEAREF